MTRETPSVKLSKAITRLSDKVDALPNIREASVHSVTGNTVQVMFDTDTAPTVVHGTLLKDPTPGARVLTLTLRHYVWVLGVKGGAGPSAPVGSMYDWPAATAPDGWLLCQGQEVSRTTYTDLFTLIGITFGAGNGSTTFNLPDTRGRVAVGVSSDTEFNALGKTFGTKTHTLTVAQIPSHSHRQYVTASAAPGPGIRTSWTGDSSSSAYDQGIDTGATGGGGAHNNIQPSIALNKIIRAL